MNTDEFVKKFCKNCNNNCSRGIIERKEFIRCVDRDIYINKSFKKNKK